MNLSHHPLVPSRFKRGSRIGDAYEASADIQAGGNVAGPNYGGNIAAGAAAGAAVGTVVPGVGNAVGAAVGAAAGAAYTFAQSLFGSGPCGDPSPGDWQSYCAANFPQGGINQTCFDSWGWGPCPPNPNVSQGVAADVNADVPPPSPPPAVVSASALASGARSSAQAYGTPAWVASMVALAATNTPQAAIAKANLAAFNAANPPVVASFRPKLALNIAPSHPLMALAKAPPIGVSASASPTETIAVLALAALGFVAWRKGWL